MAVYQPSSLKKFCIKVIASFIYTSSEFNSIPYAVQEDIHNERLKNLKIVMGNVHEEILARRYLEIKRNLHYELTTNLSYSAIRACIDNSGNKVYRHVYFTNKRGNYKSYLIYEVTNF